MEGAMVGCELRAHRAATSRIKRIVQNINECHEAGIFTEDQVPHWLEDINVYEQGTLALLRKVYRVGE
jgi:hypothetical protein